jgi:hypothetical protein
MPACVTTCDAVWQAWTTRGCCTSPPTCRSCCTWMSPAARASQPVASSTRVQPHKTAHRTAWQSLRSRSELAVLEADQPTNRERVMHETAYTCRSIRACSCTQRVVLPKVGSCIKLLCTHCKRSLAAHMYSHARWNSQRTVYKSDQLLACVACSCWGNEHVVINLVWPA